MPETEKEIQLTDGPDAAPALGGPAPFFHSHSEGSGVTLEGFKGSWTIVFSHPEDLLPVFKTRTVHYLLCKRKTRVIAICDSEAICQQGGNFITKYVSKHSLTLLDDSDREISMGYGLGESDEKGVFVVDPGGILRIKLYVPMAAQRDFHDILTLVDALQNADRAKKKHPGKSSWKSRLGLVERSGSPA